MFYGLGLLYASVLCFLYFCVFLIFICVCLFVCVTYLYMKEEACSYIVN